MAQLTSDQMALYVKEMYPVMNEKYKEEELFYPKIFYIENDVDGAGSKETQILGADKFRKKTAQGQNFQFRSPVQGWQTYVAYDTFMDAVKFDKEEVEDNVKNGQIGRTLKNYARSWGKAYRVTKEEFTSGFFNNGGALAGNAIFNGSFADQADPSGDLLYDGKPFFNLAANARTAKDGTTYYNSVVASEITETNVGTLYDLMAVTNAYSEIGTKANNEPNCILTESGSDYRKAWRICMTEKLPGGELNDKNPWYSGGGAKDVATLQPMHWRYLSGGAWYIGRAKDERLCFEDRQKPVLEFYRNKENRAYLATVDSRFGVHMKAGVWRCWTRNGGDAS